VRYEVGFPTDRSFSCACAAECKEANASDKTNTTRKARITTASYSQVDRILLNCPMLPAGDQPLPPSIS